MGVLKAHSARKEADLEEKEQFAGAYKAGSWLLRKPETWFVEKYVSKVPRGIETYHLTPLTLLWCLLNVLFCYFARENIAWLWVCSLVVILQYVTDIFDGAVGRLRNTGLVRWGYYVDHFLDYIFFCSLILGYYLIAPEGLDFLFALLLVLAGGLVVSFHLSFAATNQFRFSMYGFGPTELRIVAILLNTILIFAGADILKYVAPVACILFLMAVVLLVLKTQSTLWKIDMKAKESSTLTDEKQTPSP
jgi:phosphatidylglycerophosphate synthase